MVSVRSSFVAAFALCLCLVAAASGVAAAQGADSDKAREWCEQVLGGIAEGGALPVEGWRVGPCSLRGGTLEVLVLRNEDGAPYSLLVRPKPNYDTLGGSARFDVEAKWRGGAPEPPSTAQVLDWFSGQLQTAELRDRALPVPSAVNAAQYGYNELGTGAQAASLTLHKVLVYVELVLVFLLGLLLLIRARPGPRDIPWALLAITAVGFALRLALPPNAVWHENHHGYHYIEGALAGTGALYPGVPSAYMAFMHLPASLFAAHADTAVFVTNALLSALAAPLIGLLAGRLGADRGAALAAALLWALSPHAIRLGPTATFFAFTLVTLLAGSLCLIEGLRRRSVPWLVLAGALLALDAQSRVLTLTHPAVALGFALAAGVIRDRRAVWAVVAVSAGVLALELPWVGPALRLAGESGELMSTACIYVHLEPGVGVLPDPEITSPVMLVLALAGMIRLIAVKRPPTPRWMGAGAVLGTLALLGPVLLTCGGLIANARQFLVPAGILTVMAGVGATWLTAWVARRHSYAAVACGGALGLTALIALPFVERPFAGQLEYQLLTEQVCPSLAAQGPGILTVPPVPAPAKMIPLGWWRRHVPGWVVTRSRPQEDDAAHGFIGLECYWAEDAVFEPLVGFPGELPLHPACAKVFGGRDWREVTVEAIPHETTTEEAIGIQRGVIDIGLFKTQR